MARSASRPSNSPRSQPGDHRAIPPRNSNAGAKVPGGAKVGHWRFRSIDVRLMVNPKSPPCVKAGYVSLVAVLCVVSLVGCGSDQPPAPQRRQLLPS